MKKKIVLEKEADFCLLWLLYLRCAVLIVPYPLFDQSHKRCDVVELCFLQDS